MAGILADALKWLDSLSPFLQGILGSGAFALILLVIQQIIKWYISFNKEQKQYRAEELIKKHWVHKYLVTANGFYFFTLGYLLIISKALLWLMRAILIVCFYNGVNSLLHGDAIKMVFTVVIFTVNYEGLSWLEDKSSEDVLKKIDPKIKENVLAKLGNPLEDFDKMFKGQSSAETLLSQEKRRH